MAKAPTSPDFNRKARFQSRGVIDDGLGNEVSGPFEDRFAAWVALRPGGLSEAVVAARLEGSQVINVYVRASAQTREITSDWRMIVNDHGEERIYAVNAQPDGLTMKGFIYFQAKSGVAS